MWKLLYVPRNHPLAIRISIPDRVTGSEQVMVRVAPDMEEEAFREFSAGVQRNPEAYQTVEVILWEFSSPSLLRGGLDAHCEVVVDYVGNLAITTQVPGGERNRLTIAVERWEEEFEWSIDPDGRWSSRRDKSS